MNFSKIIAAMFISIQTAYASEYPNKPIRLIAPLPAGSSTDIVARTYATPLSNLLGQNVVVVNRAGADGLIAGTDVIRSQPDGYTLFFATNTPMAAGPALRKVPPYDPVKDFTPIIDLGRFTFFLITNNNVSISSVNDLIAFAKQNPNRITYATGNTTGIVGMAQIAALTNTKMIHVPYKGEPQAMVDLIAGHVQVMLASSGTALPQIREGKVRVLAVATNTRSHVLNNVPTLNESGVKDFSITSWAAVYGPANLPSHIVTKLNLAFKTVSDMPEVREAMEKIAFTQTGSTPEALLKFTEQQYNEYKSILSNAGVDLQ